MDKLRQYFNKNFEQFFVLFVLVFTSAINHLIEQKLAFLNFYFLPIILAGYYLGSKKSAFGAVLCTLLVFIYVVLDPTKFQVKYNPTDMYLHLIVWASFLMLAGIVVGKQHEKINHSLIGILNLNKNLQNKQIELNQANKELQKYSNDLESMVSARTEELENSKRTLESLKSKVEATLYSTMDSSVAKLMMEGRLRSEKRKISVMFSDLVGFTSYSENLNPEIVVKDLNQYLNEMEPILLDYHAHIDKFLGDGIMAEFGAPIDHEHYRLLAVLSGLEMQDKMRTINLPWEIKIGIASGSAITGLIGSQRQSYTSIGDVVNIASRLENQCPPGEIIIDEYTYEGVKRFINTCNYQLTTQEYKKEQTIRDQVDQLTQELLKTETIPIRATILKELSELYVQIAEEDLAYQALQNAIALQPNEPMYKLAMADMVISKEQKRTIKVKGRKKSLKAFKVIGIKDSLNDPNKIPPKLYKKFKPILQSIEIPQRFSLKVEAIDGSIGHSNAVALLAYAMASKLNVYDKENIDILIAGFAADFGKEIISHHILNRKGNLSNNEILEVQKHPVESIRILKSMGYKSDNIFSIIRHSHERINGGGYPNGLKGEQIPLGSRIIAVADTYDALTSWRPYREKWDRAAAIDEIKKSVIRGWYDPIVVNALIDLFNENLPESEIPINKLAS